MSNHPLDLFRDQGGVTLADIDSAGEPHRLADGSTINPLFWAAAGERDEQRALSDDQRAANARAIESSVSQYRAWVESRPPMEQVRLLNAPVIGLGPSDDDTADDDTAAATAE